MPDNRLIPIFQQAGDQYGIDPTLLMALSKQESGINPNVRDSYQGAQGLMQLMPRTAMGLGVTNPRDPMQAIPAAAAYLAEGYSKTGTPEGALHYYHGGPDPRQWGPKGQAYVKGVSANYVAMKKEPKDSGSSILDEVSAALSAPTATPENKSAATTAGSDNILDQVSSALGGTPKTVQAATTTPDPDEGVRSIERDIANQVAGRPRGGRDISGDIPARISQDLFNPNVSDAEMAQRRAVALNRLQTAGGAVLNALAATPSAITSRISGAYQTAQSGLSDIGAGNLGPSALPANSLVLNPGDPTGGFNSLPYPDTPQAPSEWNPGGLLKVAGGVAGIPGSLVAGPAHTLIGEPVTQLTGSPRIGAGAEAVANVAGGNALVNNLTGRIPGPVDPETLRLAQAADAWGIPIRNSQISTNPLIKKTDQMLGFIPGSGQPAQRAQQAGAFTKAVSNTFGEDTPQITRATIGQAQKRIGDVMDGVESRTNVALDQPMMNRFADLEGSLRQALGPDDPVYKKIDAQLNDIFDKAAINKGVLPGESWKALTTYKSPLNRLAESQDATLAGPAKEILETLRDGIQRSAAPEDATAYQRARFQYKNLKTVEPLVTRGTPGEVSPLNLGTQVNKQFDPRNAGPLGDLADIGQRFMRSPADSGTPLGEKVLGALTSAPAMIAGGLVGGGGAHMAGFSMPEIGQGLAALGAGAASARGLSMTLNNPVYRAWLLSHAPGTGNKLINTP